MPLSFNPYILNCIQAHPSSRPAQHEEKNDHAERTSTPEEPEADDKSSTKHLRHIPTPIESTSSLSADAVRVRNMEYGGVIAAASAILVLAGVYVICRHRARKAAAAEAEKQAAAAAASGGDKKKILPVGQSREGGGVGYAPLLGDAASEAAGLGMLSEEEEREALAEDLEQLSPEQRELRLAEWAVQREEKLREQHAVYLGRRKVALVVLLVLYISVSVGLPYVRRGEVSCAKGYFWETHMLFLATFVLTKLVELWLFAEDETVERDIGFVMMFIKFGPSFLGYLDAYTDANAFFIADACDNNVAHILAVAMAVAYLIGVVILQWGVMFYFALQDPSHACLLKLLHMDLLASCVSLPPDQKSTWDMLAVVRTVGEDVPQALLQTIYLFKVKKNPFMLISVCMAVGSSLKALYDARNRHLAAAGLEEKFENRERDLMVYSCSQDGTIRCWDVQAGNCSTVIDCGNPANCVAASRGMLFSSHDDGKVREWSPETKQVTRTFDHPGGNAIVLSTADRLYTWAVGGGDPVYKVWSLETGESLRDFPGANTFKASIFVKDDNFFCTSHEAQAAVARWSLATGDFIKEYSGHRRPINALFATSKRLLTGSQDGTVKEWSLSTDECTRTFDDHTRSFLAPLMVVRELMYNASGKEEGLINEWSLATGQVLRQFAGHEGTVLSIVRLKEKLYSSSEDTTIKEWSLESGECLQTFEGHTDYISGIMVQYRDD
eukprot:TRINITY_DN13233_c0_g2_i2.p1 TRINITY_DN13233_c0_g2~~TRINITY_DN13233_c0_g2_i2.p1  ORF type:complete len:766 (+),score=77.04 TRINITY_DN13233_c0_g2_i2:129-2300(+)